MEIEGALDELGRDGANDGEALSVRALWEEQRKG